MESSEVINAVATWGRTVLIWAGVNGHIESVKVLIAAGADGNAKYEDTKYRDNRTLLMYAADGGQLEMVKVLIAAGTAVNAKDESGVTALMHAAGGGHTETVKVLIAAGANVNAISDYGRTALMSAAGGGHAETMKILQAAGAKLKGGGESKLACIRTAHYIPDSWRRRSDDELVDVAKRIQIDSPSDSERRMELIVGAVADCDAPITGR